MNFYTSVIQYGNSILYRGYENGRSVKEKITFSPTLYIKAKKKTDFKTLTGEYLEPIEMEDINAAKDFVKKYSDVENFQIFGMQNYQYQFIADRFEGEIKFDLNSMRIWSIDIECESEDGFPDPSVAPEKILLISVEDLSTGQNIVWGWKPYNKEPKDNLSLIHI